MTEPTEAAKFAAQQIAPPQYKWFGKSAAQIIQDAIDEVVVEKDADIADLKFRLQDKVMDKQIVLHRKSEKVYEVLEYALRSKIERLKQQLKLLEEKFGDSVALFDEMRNAILNEPDRTNDVINWALAIVDSVFAGSHLDDESRRLKQELADTTNPD